MLLYLSSSSIIISFGALFNKFFSVLLCKDLSYCKFKLLLFILSIIISSILFYLFIFDTSSLSLNNFVKLKSSFEFIFSLISFNNI